MEIHSMLAHERPQIHVNGSPESIPTRKSLPLLALEIPEGIADVLKIEAHTALQQTRSLAAPISEEVTVWTLARFMTVRSAQSFLMSLLGISAGHKEKHRSPQYIYEFSG